MGIGARKICFSKIKDMMRKAVGRERKKIKNRAISLKLLAIS